MTVWRRVKVARIRAAAVDPHHRVASISDQAVEDELLQCGDHGTLDIGQCRQQLVVDELRRDGAAPNLLHGVDRATTHARAASWTRHPCFWPETYAGLFGG
jgi:hypothetical protein